MIMDTQQENVLDIGCKPVLEWAKNLHAAVLSGSVAHCAQSVKLFNNRDGNR